MASPGTSELEALLVKHLTGAVDKVEKRLEEKFSSWMAQAFEGVNYDETEEQEEEICVIDTEEPQAGTSGCSEGLKAGDQGVDETKLGDQGGSIIERLKEKYKKVDKKGDDISSNMLDVIQSIMSFGRSDEIQKLADNTLAPANAPEFEPTRVSDVIWSALHNRVKTVDCKFQTVQKILLKGMILVARVCDGLVTSATGTEEMAQLTTTATDALSVLALTNTTINHTRLELIKPEIAKDFAHLCNTPPIPGKELFGEDIGQRMKDITEANKAGFKLKASRYHPYKVQSPAPRGGRGAFQTLRGFSRGGVEARVEAGAIF